MMPPLKGPAHTKNATARGGERERKKNKKERERERDRKQIHYGEYSLWRAFTMASKIATAVVKYYNEVLYPGELRGQQQIDTDNKPLQRS